MPTLKRLILYILRYWTTLKKKRRKLYNANIWSGSVLFISKTLPLAFPAKGSAGKSSEIGMAKDEYDMRYTHTLPSIRGQSWPTKSYGLARQQQPTKTPDWTGHTKGSHPWTVFCATILAEQQSQPDVFLLQFYPPASKRHFGAKC